MKHINLFESFVGPNGVDTFNMIGEYYTAESNDPYDNN